MPKSVTTVETHSAKVFRFDADGNKHKIGFLVYDTGRGFFNATFDGKKGDVDLGPFSSIGRAKKAIYDAWAKES